MNNRKDYSNQIVFTIDGEDARDFDDAISLEMQGDLFKLFVHIADVSHYVKKNSEIDKEAFKRGTSVYFPDYVIPMLPEALSNEMCSLKPNVDRLTLSLEMLIDKNGNVIDHQIFEGVIHSNYRLTYTIVTKILNHDSVLCEKYKNIVPMLDNMSKLTDILIKRRDVMGQLDFNIAECQIVVNDKYETVDIKRKPREKSDRLIEQFMLIANETIAKHFSLLNVPFVYRIHQSPTPEGIARFNDFISALGLINCKISDKSVPKDFQKILIGTKNKPEEQMISKMMLRSMQKAIYYEKNLGHFGLACKNYCHFTSPIRRLADLTIHRIIKSVLHSNLSKDVSTLDSYVHDVSEHASVTEQNADEVERAVDDLKKAEFMSNKVGQSFTGIVSGVIETGIFVELDNTVEGFVPIDKLPMDHYYFEDKRVRLVGRAHEYALGQKLSVKVDNVDVGLSRINFIINDINNVNI